MKVYLDSDYRCHLSGGEGARSVELSALDGMCEAYIEGQRFIPAGETWTRSDGVVFAGEMLAPAEDFQRLEKAQQQYELDETRRLSDLGIPWEEGFTATRNYAVGSFLSVHGVLYEVLSSIPRACSIVLGQNVIKTTIEHYLDALKEKET